MSVCYGIMSVSEIHKNSFIVFFRKSGFIRRHTIVQKDFERTCADYRISGEKGFASRLSNSLDWWGKTHFFCAYAREVLLRLFRWFFFFAVLLSRKRKAVYDRLPINGTSRHPQLANREEWFYLPAPTRPARQIKPYFLAGGLPGFTLPTMSFFGGTSFFHGFLFWSFLSNLPLLPFTSIFAPFSESHQAVISVLGAKVTPGFDGKARSSLLFSGKISSPSGSIFPEKTCIP